MPIRYVVGDATAPQRKAGEKVIIPHVCNCEGGWGRGFVLALSKKWREPEATYRRRYRTGTMKLGDVHFVLVDDTTYVANMVAQVLHWNDGPPIRYDALHQCLKDVANEARAWGASIHAPRFGAGLAGGEWAFIEKMINTYMPDLDVVIYDLPTT
jgi:O-acetyl-ADP-ribose deacetylase (regulator of RNase III)